MGGQKKKPAGKQAKTQSTNAETKTDSKKSKKDKSDSKPASSVIINEKECLEIIKKTRGFTVQEFARQAGLKISTANSFLVKSLDSGTVKRIGGFSGHHIYQATE